MGHTGLDLADSGGGGVFVGGGRIVVEVRGESVFGSGHGGGLVRSWQFSCFKSLWKIRDGIFPGARAYMGNKLLGSNLGPKYNDRVTEGFLAC